MEYISVPVVPEPSFLTSPEAFAADIPLETITWEPEIMTIQAYGSSIMEYRREWRPANLGQLNRNMSGEELGRMRAEVQRHAEANGMPSRWREHIHLYAPQIYHSTGDIQMANTDLEWNSWQTTTGTSNTSSNHTSTVGSNSTTDGVWNTWVGQEAPVDYEQRVYQDYVPRLSDEQIQQNQERVREQQRQAKERKLKQCEAKQKAEKLLLSLLDEGQKKEFATYRTVTVKVDPEKEYVIREGRVGNIRERNPVTKKIQRWCVHVGKQVPDVDNMVAQFLWLNTNPENMMGMANAM